MRAIFTCILVFAGAAGAAPPKPLDPSLKLELVAEAPDIVTPTGVAVDSSGRIYIIENHTHQRPANYTGPKTDRIRLLDQFDEKTGQAKRIRTVHEGFSNGMGLAFDSKGRLVLATRNEIVRLELNKEGDGVANSKRLVHLETKGNYPHNGLSAPIFDILGNMFFGMGENLGEPYKLIGSDGTSINGGGEGGNVFRVDSEGGKLMRVATGFWNPFAMAFNEKQQLFAVDNDPDARGPCRLLHVVLGGDYGYKFQYGRKGTHPFVCWNGELPGTLPMVAGTLEAPSGIIRNPFSSLNLDFLVTSWGDHVLEGFLLKPKGASYSAYVRSLLQGGEDFRPVGLALAPDGSVVMTDWVDKSYPVHAKGRVWRIVERPTPRILSVEEEAIKKLKDGMDKIRKRKKREVPGKTPEIETQLSVWELSRQYLVKSLESGDMKNFDFFMDNTDPYMRSRNIRDFSQLDKEDFAKVFESRRGHSSPRMRVNLILMAHRSGRSLEQFNLERFLKDPDPDVRRTVLRIIAEGNNPGKEAEARLADALTVQPVTTEVQEAYLAAKDWIANKGATTKRPEFYAGEAVAKMVADDKLPKDVRALALKLADPAHPSLKTAFLAPWTEEPATAKQALKLIALQPGPESKKFFEEGLKTRNDDSLFASWADVRLAEPRKEPAAVEGLPKDLPGWKTALEGKGDAEAGELLFFHPNGPGCAACHKVGGCGAAVGPELTRVGAALSREKLLESIFDPSKEIAPLFTAWTIDTKDGKSRMGLIVSDNHDSTLSVADQTGKIEKIRKLDIDEKRASTKSLMPDGLEKRMTVGQFRDLLAYLESLK